MAADGYRRPLLTLRFTDPQFEGLQVKCRRISCEEMFAFSEASSAAGGEGTRAMLEPLADLLVGTSATRPTAVILEWNLLDYLGNPVPYTTAGLLGQDLPLLLAIAAALTEAAAGVPAPLPPTSGGGPPLEVASIPMEPCVGNRESTSAPG